MYRTITFLKGKYESNTYTPYTYHDVKHCLNVKITSVFFQKFYIFLLLKELVQSENTTH